MGTATYTAPFTVERAGCQIDCVVEGTVTGKYGRIEEVYDVTAKCLCGADLELTYEEECLAVATLENAAAEQAGDWMIDRAEYAREYGE